MIRLAVCLFLTVLSSYSSELFINGEINEDTYTKLTRDYDNLKQKSNIVLKIDSPGGDLYHMYKISEFVSSKKLNTFCLSECFSAAAVIFLHGKNRDMDKQSKLLIHEYNLPVKQGRYTVSQLQLIVKNNERIYFNYLGLIVNLLKVHPKVLLEKIIPGKNWIIDYKEAKQLRLIN